MTDDRRPIDERRATDGLDWAIAPPAAAPAQQPAAPTEPAALAQGRPSALLARLSLFASAVAAGLTAGFVGGWIALSVFDDEEPASTAPANQPVTNQAVEVTSAITDVAAASRAGVVRVDTTRRTAGGTEKDTGSGLVIDAERGYIVTNAHVVLGANTITVATAGGQPQSAILVGHDYPFTDIAVLQTAPLSVAALRFGDSTRVKPGEPVVVIGNPLGQFEGSVTTGVVSGVGRSRVFEGVLQEGLIQTDAAINHGNSGGALLNIGGLVIGIPTSVVQTAQGEPVTSIAFALPAHRFQPVVQRIIAEGANYPRPSVGADVVELTPELLARLPRTPAEDGALITAVESSGPAAAAGLAVGDVITRVDGRAVDAGHPFLSAIADLQPGQTAKLVLNRAGRIIEADVVLAKRR